MPASGATQGKVTRLTPCINGATTMPYLLEDDIRSAASAGFPLIELWAPKLPPYLAAHTLADLRATLRANGLGVAALCPYGLRMFGAWREGLAGVERGVAAAAELGAPLLLVCPDAPPADLDRGEAVEIAAERARTYGDVAQAAGVRLAIEPLGGHPFVPGAREAMEVLHRAAHPALGLMMDTFHYYKSRVSEEDIRGVPPGLWTILHVNDVPPGAPEGLSDPDRLYPGEGVLPLADTLRYFAGIGFRGAVSVEVFRRAYWEQPAEEIARRAYAGVTGALRAAGAAG